MKHTSFTLVEILVVIAVIAILAGLLMPTLSTARKSGNRAYCINNLNQIGKALEMYAQENKEFFPRNSTSQKLTDSSRTPLSATLMPYLKTDKVFKCPDEHEKLFETEGSSYIWNWLQIEIPGNERAGLTKYNAYPLGIVSASGFPVIIDAAGYHGKRGEKRSINVLFADWSVNTAAEIKF